MAAPGDADSPGGEGVDPLVGRVLQDRYRILGRIAEGGMGAVYRAERLQLHRTVAVKFLHPAMAKEPIVVRRFEIEARAMSRLAHPNCVSVIDFGVDEQPYLVMDFIQGTELRSVMAAGPLEAGRALRIARQLLAALEHAHAHAIIHRDIKPENILLERGAGLEDHVRILDFGLAKMIGTDFGLTVGVAIGTPNYMAPEQAREGTVDARTDLYAVAVVLFEMLTGVKPFDAKEVGEVLARQMSEARPRLREIALGQGFSAELEAFLLRAMARRPEDRFATASAMGAALETVPEAAAAGLRATTPPGENGATLREPAPAWTVDPTTASGRFRRISEVISLTSAEVVSWSSATRRRAIIVGVTVGAAIVALAFVAVWSRRPPEASLPPQPPPVIVRPTPVVAPVEPAVAPAAPVVAPAAPVIAPVLAPAPGLPVHAHAARTPAGTGRAPAPPPHGPGAAHAASASTDPVARLRALRRAEPRKAEHVVALARLYYERHRYTDAVAESRAAIALDPREKSDPALTRGAIEALGNDQSQKAASALLRELGAAARPQLQHAAKAHPNAQVRARAAELIRPPPPKKEKPFLKWL